MHVPWVHHVLAKIVLQHATQGRARSLGDVDEQNPLGSPGNRNSCPHTDKASINPLSQP